MLAKQEPMVRGQDKGGVGPQIMLVKDIQKLAEIFICHGDKGGIIRPQLGNFLGCLLDPVIDGPVQNRTVIGGFVSVTEPGWRMERLMRVKAFKLEKPVIGPVIALQEFIGKPEKLR